MLKKSLLLPTVLFLTLSAMSCLSLPDFSSVAQRVLPTVIQVETLSTASGQGLPWNYFYNNPDDIKDIPENKNQGLGSGVLMKREGSTYYALTNAHVIVDAEEIQVRLSTGVVHKARLIGEDDRMDLALVAFETEEDLPLAKIGDSDKLQVGDWVLAIGHPLGLDSTVTAGIVSALGRRGGPEGNISDFIQTDASINQGNSGGALVDKKGRLVGINSWIATPTGSSVGLGFALPINNVRYVVEDFIQYGTIRYGWLGVSLISLDPDSRESLEIPDSSGGFVSQIFRDSPADVAGLLPGDFIIAFEDKAVQSIEELIFQIGQIRPEEEAGFRVIRSGEVKDISVVLGERSTETGISALNSQLWPGFVVTPIPEEGGLKVLQVYPRTLFQRGGLRSNDVIVKMDQAQVKSLLEFYQKLNDINKKSLDITILRDKEEINLSIPLENDEEDNE